MEGFYIKHIKSHFYPSTALINQESTVQTLNNPCFSGVSSYQSQLCPEETKVVVSLCRLAVGKITGIQGYYVFPRRIFNQKLFLSLVSNSLS
jgi:hypothetical protein